MTVFFFSFRAKSMSKRVTIAVHVIYLGIQRTYRRQSTGIYSTRYGCFNVSLNIHRFSVRFIFNDYWWCIQWIKTINNYKYIFNSFELIRELMFYDLKNKTQNFNLLLSCSAKLVLFTLDWWMYATIIRSNLTMSATIV